MRGFGEEGGPVHLVEPPLEVNNGFDEQSSKQVDLLFFACTASAEVLSEGLILDMVPADAHSEAESTSGKQIDVGGLAGHQCCLTLRKDEHAGGQPDSLGDASEVAEHDERVVKRIALGLGTGKWRCAIFVYCAQYVVIGK